MFYLALGAIVTLVLVVSAGMAILHNTYRKGDTILSGQVRDLVALSEYANAQIRMNNARLDELCKEVRGGDI